MVLQSQFSVIHSVWSITSLTLWECLFFFSPFLRSKILSFIISFNISKLKEFDTSEFCNLAAPCSYLSRYNVGNFSPTVTYPRSDNASITGNVDDMENDDGGGQKKIMMMLLGL